MEQVEKWFGKSKQLASLRTVTAHIENMFTGVLKGFRYFMRSVYAHFPINVAIEDGGKRVEIRNFLGEKRTRVIHMLDGKQYSVRWIPLLLFLSSFFSSFSFFENES